MQNTEFDRYTHIIFAGGKYKNYRPEFNKELEQWIRKGGTIIGIRQGADWIQNKLLDSDVKNDKAEQINNSDIRYAYAEKEGRDPLEFIGGTIFAGDLDITHPLGFGYSNKNIALHKNTTSILSRPKNPYGTVIAYKDSPILSGYASENNQRAIANTAALVAERYGNGSIILFADDPNFRATWYGTNKLFLNSLFFSLAFEQPR